MNATTEKQIDGLINAMDAIVTIACGGENSGIGEIWIDGKLDKVERYLERIEIYANDEGLEPGADLLFEAAHKLLEAAMILAD
jgi:hypothetical protein